MSKCVRLLVFLGLSLLAGCDYPTDTSGGFPTNSRLKSLWFSELTMLPAFDSLRTDYSGGGGGYAFEEVTVNATPEDALASFGCSVNGGEMVQMQISDPLVVSNFQQGFNAITVTVYSQAAGYGNETMTKDGPLYTVYTISFDHQ